MTAPVGTDVVIELLLPNTKDTITFEITPVQVAPVNAVYTRKISPVVYHLQIDRTGPTFY